MANINLPASSPEEAYALMSIVADMAPAQRPTIMLHGEPGSSKSSLVRQLSLARFGKPPIDVRAATIEASDVKGLPDLDRSKDRIVWRKPDFLPRSGEGVLFFDEVTSARRDVIAALYSIALDRRVDDLELPAGYMIVFAGNDVSDGTIAHDMGTAMNDRLMHIHVHPTAASFVSYWESRDLHPAILALITQMPHLLSQNEDRIANDYIASPTPRSWERASNMMKAIIASNPKTSEQLLRLAMSGIVGQQAAEHLILTWSDMNECADPRLLLAMDIARDTQKLRKALPKTARAGIGLAYAFGHMCEKPDDIVKAIAIMALFEMQAPDASGQPDGTVRMTGAEIAALGVERLIRKAEALGEKAYLDIISKPRPGQDIVLAYLESVGERSRRRQA